MSGFSPAQDYSVVTVRSAAVLTNSYVAGTVIGLSSDPASDHNELRNQLILLVDFTLGSLTTAEIKVEFSPDNSTWFQEVFGSISGGTETDTLGIHQIATTGLYRIPIQTKDRFIKVSAKGTGTVTNSSMAIKAIIGVA